MTLPFDPPDFALTCRLMLAGVNFRLDIDAVDDWIASRAFSAEKLAALDSKREQAVAAFLRNDWDSVAQALTDWHTYAIFLRNAPYAAAARKAEKQRLDASKKARPAAKSEFKKAIQAIMRPAKLAGDEFKDFMKSWQLGPIEGLRATIALDGVLYSISDENGEVGDSTYAWNSLKMMYSTCTRKN